jgi:hypothetical protein
MYSITEVNCQMLNKQADIYLLDDKIELSTMLQRWEWRHIGIQRGQARGLFSRISLTMVLVLVPCGENSQICSAMQQARVAYH